MKKIYLAFVLNCLLVNLIFANTNNELRVVYYSTIEFVETPLPYIKGSVPLQKQVALSRNHYRFSYNELDQLISVAFYNGSTPRNPNHTASHFTLSHKMEFEYGNTYEKITFFNTKGQQITVLGNCYEFVYKLNEIGFRESLYFLNNSGDRVENSWNIYEYSWEHLPDGTVIEDRFDKNGKQISLRPNFEFYRLKLYYNNAGRIELMQNIDENGNLVENSTGASQDDIKTNKHGNLLQWRVLDNNHQLEKGNGPDVAIGIQKINEFGYEVGIEHRDENNKPIYNKYGFCISETEFDKYGNLSERRFYNEAHKPSNHKLAGYHMLKIEWDKSGNYRKQLSYYGINEEPTVHKTRGYHIVKYDYNRNKTLAKISFLGTDEKLINRTDNGISYLIYQYNENEKQTGVLKFDKNGKQLL